MKTGLEGKSEAELHHLERMAENGISTFWAEIVRGKCKPGWIDAARGLRALVTAELCRRRVEAPR